MRWLIIHPGPQFSVADVYTGWLEALRKLGQDLIIYNLHERISFYDRALIEVEEDDKTPTHWEIRDENTTIKIRKALTAEQALQLAANGILSTCYQYWPDVILSISSFFMTPDLLTVMQARKHKIVLVHTESPYQDEEQIARAEHASYNVINDQTNIDAFRAVAPTDYYPQAYRPLVHRPGRALPELQCDLGFVGTAFESRVKFFEAMNLEGLDVLLGGNWSKLEKESPLIKYLAHDIDDCLDNDQTVDIYRSAKMGINFYRREHSFYEPQHVSGWAIGPREVEMAACGLPFLRDPRPESDELFPFLPTFTSPEEASEKLRWALARPQWRDKVRADAYAAIQDRTFENNAKRLLTKLEGL